MALNFKDQNENQGFKDTPEGKLSLWCDKI